MKEQITKLLDGALMMPKLVHNVCGEKGEPFDILRSEVAAWLVEQPGVKQFVFNKVREAGMIVYDKEAGTWKGVGVDNYKRGSSTGGRPSVFSADMISAALVEGGSKGIGNRELRKLMAARGMSENTYYRLRGIAVASGKIEQTDNGMWRIVDKNRPAEQEVPRGTTAAMKPAKKREPMPHPGRPLTEEEFDQIISDLTLRHQQRGDCLDYNKVKPWIEQNVLFRQAYNSYEIDGMMNGRTKEGDPLNVMIIATPPPGQ